MWATYFVPPFLPARTVSTCGPCQCSVAVRGRSDCGTCKYRGDDKLPALLIIQVPMHLTQLSSTEPVMGTSIVAREPTSLSEAYPGGRLPTNSNRRLNAQHPAKRPRVDPAKPGHNARVGLSKKVLGRLSELPTMSLDVLFEIFEHLHPSDLLSLTRVNKGFRYLLLSRHSSFVWNACFKYCRAPTTPADMTPPAWARLLFGGAYCYSCGAKPVTRILFSLRRRACKSCMTSHLLCLSKVPEDIRDMIRSDSGNSGSTIHQSRLSCNNHWWDEDVAAFCAEQTALKDISRDPDGRVTNIKATVSEFLAKKKEVVATLRNHALICAAWERDRNADRSSKLTDVRVKRFEDIKFRFLHLGYFEGDLNNLSRHREVRMSKPMSNRVWQRIEPLLRPLVNEARDRRLTRDGGENYRLRRQLVLAEYAAFLRTLPPILLALSPTATEFICENQAVADALALGIGPDHPPITDRTVEAINRLRPELEKRMRERARLLRSLLPQSDISEDVTDDKAISLATSVYECTDCRLPTSGLHMLAHNCDRAQKPNTLHPQLSEQGRETVETLLQLLELGRNTTALDLDRRNDKFVCMCCSQGTFPQNGEEVLGRCVRDWRSCVTHAVGSRNERWHKGNPSWCLVGSTEIAAMSWEEFTNTHAYGCMRCPARIDLNSGSVQWYNKVSDVRVHAQIEHGRNKPQEGEDFFFNYGVRRLGCRALLAIDPGNGSMTSSL
ncbi:hypothetical protein F5148DRAFT_1204959 [Russula earlei]|uniref:Uncharacterized protein n=1 Tax=Russula earlei TaxID=71964 RepID=A0ACC0U6T4_9AGAM|nr:hypothetical protein F5148DRAFT_1204959 [Russula earlei]